MRSLVASLIVLSVLYFLDKDYNNGRFLVADTVQLDDVIRKFGNGIAQVPTYRAREY
jgi:hypothetical protein